MSTSIWFRLCLGLAILFIISGNLVFAATGFFKVGNPTSGTIVFLGFAFFIAAALPVGLFYFVLKARLGTGRGRLEDSSIDSVYYLGFLITLITLLATVISYGIFDLGDVKKASISVIFIGVSFALSLASTALALFCRVDLVQQRDALASQFEGQAMDKLITDRFFQLDETYRRLSTTMSEASDRFETTLKSNNAAVVAHVSEIAKVAKDGLTEVVHAATNEVSAAEKTLREATERSVEAISANNATLFKQMEQTIEHVKTALIEYVRAAALQASSSELAKAAAAVTSSLRKASTDLIALFTQLEELQKRAAGAVRSVDSLDSQVRAANESARAVDQNLARTSSDASTLDIEPVRTKLTQLERSISKLDETVASTGKQYAGASESALGAVRSTTEDLGDATRELSNAFVSLSAELKRSASSIVRDLP
jgi:uncharacterized damage-inducible protein DinB